ncbi:uncharacterized protein [Physcomitrium patens]|uniref:Uncharacterized protein n=2 Tax=Physcomitrium patens TaxID=3218 RepID=A0A2K1JW05_PHYPA|nr:uncharacterized protein LOC112289006 [Physcomitrium patens]PNR45703.1 hypothetical protein PHYPA_015474 [Physcomitrium patens]|eukprot:XP_024389629.1 uncharacterized protein LOC112289006 [Physcomitrella patens]
MEDEQENIESMETIVPRPPVLLAERVRARPRHSLPRRLARAARAALQSHFPSLPPLKTSASSRIPLAPERATGLFRSGALETHIARALGNTVGLDEILTVNKEPLKLFSSVKNLPGAVTYAAVSRNEVSQSLQLSGKHPLGPTTVCETIVQGTKVSLLELQLRINHTLTSPLQSDPVLSEAPGRIALITATDFQSRHRVTMESTLGSEKHKHSLSTVVSSDLRAKLSWGLSTCHNVNEKVVLFSRYNNDAYAGQRIILQAVNKVDKRNTISPICAITLGSITQGGLSWTRSFSQHGEGEESLQLKALCSSNGSYVVSVKAQLGEIES